MPSLLKNKSGYLPIRQFILMGSTVRSQTNVQQMPFKMPFYSVKKKKKQDVLKAVASSPQISNRHHCHQVYLKFHRDTEESEEVHVHYQ